MENVSGTHISQLGQEVRVYRSTALLEHFVVSVNDLSPDFVLMPKDWYDFHGECDLVFLDNPDFASGTGMDIHSKCSGSANHT